jgi:hypothetical protein
MWLVDINRYWYIIAQQATVQSWNWAFAVQLFVWRLWWQEKEGGGEKPNPKLTCIPVLVVTLARFIYY